MLSAVLSREPLYPFIIFPSCVCDDSTVSLSSSLFFFSLSFIPFFQLFIALLGCIRNFFLKATPLKEANHCRSTPVGCPCFGEWKALVVSSDNENIIYRRDTSPAEKLCSDLFCQNGVFRAGNRVKENRRHCGKCQVNCIAMQSVHQIKAYSLACFSKKKTFMDQHNGCCKIARILQ